MQLLSDLSLSPTSSERTADIAFACHVVVEHSLLSMDHQRNGCWHRSHLRHFLQCSRFAERCIFHQAEDVCNVDPRLKHANAL